MALEPLKPIHSKHFSRRKRKTLMCLKYCDSTARRRYLPLVKTPGHLQALPIQTGLLSHPHSRYRSTQPRWLLEERKKIFYPVRLKQSATSAPPPSGRTGFGVSPRPAVPPLRLPYRRRWRRLVLTDAATTTPEKDFGGRGGENRVSTSSSRVEGLWNKRAERPQRA
jgi:hypothetical protein